MPNDCNSIRTNLQALDIGHLLQRPTIFAVDLHLPHSAIYDVKQEVNHYTVYISSTRLDRHTCTHVRWTRILFGLN